MITAWFIPLTFPAIDGRLTLAGTATPDASAALYVTVFVDCAGVPLAGVNGGDGLGALENELRVDDDDHELDDDDEELDDELEGG